MERIAVVTGGAGFIGRHLVQALLADGTHVRIVDPAQCPKAWVKALDYRCASILDRDALRAAFRGAQELYHVAAVAHLWIDQRERYERVNVEGTKIVLEEAATARIGCIVATSSETMLRDWRDTTSRAIRAGDPVPALNRLAGPYARSKAIAHQLLVGAGDQGLPVRIVYPTIPIGPGDEALTPPTVMVRDFLRGRSPAYLDSLMNFVPVEGAAGGHILAARRGSPGGRYILSGEDLRLSQLLAIIERVSGRTMPRLAIPFWLAYCAGMTSTLIADCITRKPPMAPLEGVRLAYAARTVDGSSARCELGFDPGSVADAVKRLIDWLKAEVLI